MVRALLLYLLAWVAALLPAIAQSPSTPPHLTKDLRDLIEMRTGHWSTDRQVFFWTEAGYAGPAPAGVTEWHVQNGEDGELFSVLTMLKDVRGEYRHAFRIEEGGVEERIGDDACVLRWERGAGGFVGSADAGRCELLGPDAATLFLTPTDLEVRGEPARAFRKARQFTCWAALLRGAAHGDSGEGMDSWDFRQGLTLHDQGGETVIVSDEAPPRKVKLKLRDVDWPYGDRRASLTLYVMEGEMDRAVSYAWTGGGEDRIGINLRWLQASCTRDGAET